MSKGLDAPTSLENDQSGAGALDGALHEHLHEYQSKVQNLIDLDPPEGVAAVEQAEGMLPRFSVNGKPVAVESWKDLGPGKPLSPCGDAKLYQFRADKSSFDLVVADFKSNLWELVPAINKKPRPTSELAEKDNATAAVNGAYFIPADGTSVGYITIDGKTKEDPHNNRRLTHDPNAKPYLPQIYNRSEIRVLKDNKGNADLDVCRHDDPLPKGWHLVNAMQAGPQLLPTLTSRDEAFIRPDMRKPKNGEGHRPDIDSIRTQSPAARTAIGITADDHLLILSVAEPAHQRNSRGVTLKQMADVLKQLGCVKALNLDGGASTTMFVRINPKAGECTMSPGQDVNTRHPETWVKSILELRPVLK